MQEASKPTIMPAAMDMPPSPAEGADMREGTWLKLEVDVVRIEWRGKASHDWKGCPDEIAQLYVSKSTLIHTLRRSTCVRVVDGRDPGSDGCSLQLLQLSSSNGCRSSSILVATRIWSTAQLGSLRADAIGEKEGGRSGRWNVSTRVTTKSIWW
jgi:hypothetical protein